MQAAGNKGLNPKSNKENVIIFERKEGNFSNQGKDSCFAKEDDLQKKNSCYNLRSR